MSGYYGPIHESGRCDTCMQPVIDCHCDGCPNIEDPEANCDCPEWQDQYGPEQLTLPGIGAHESTPTTDTTNNQPNRTTT